MWKGYHGVFSNISNPNIVIETEAKKLGLRKTLDITSVVKSVSQLPTF